MIIGQIERKILEYLKLGPRLSWEIVGWIGDQSSPSAVMAALGRLEKKGLVDRERIPGNGNRLVSRYLFSRHLSAEGEKEVKR